MRIVAGKFGGRRLQAPPGNETRPTVERVREALFSILGPSVVGARVLDCYAGSGSLGIEALSRGAASVVFIDKGQIPASIVRDNLASLGLTQNNLARVLQRDVEDCASLLRTLGPFDMVFVDPPFAAVRDGSALEAVAALVRAEILAQDALVVIEFPSNQPTPRIAGLDEESVRPYGDTRLAFLRPAKNQQNGDKVLEA